MPEETNTTVDGYTTVPTYDEAAEGIEENQQYTDQASIYDEQYDISQKGLENQRDDVISSYADQRQQTINAYQDTLDNLNRSLREVGISTRAGSAERNLYDASGELSGIGKGVAARNVEPVMSQFTKAGERHTQALSNLSRDEQKALRDVDLQLESLTTLTKQQKLDLKNQIIAGLQSTAAETRKFEVEAYRDTRDYALDVAEFELKQLKESRLTPGTAEFRKENRLKQQEKGRTYIKTPAERDALRNAGIPVMEIGDDWFIMSEKENLDIQKQIYDLNKPYFKPGGAPTPHNMKIENMRSGGQSIDARRVTDPKTGYSYYIDSNNEQLIFQNGNLYREGNMSLADGGQALELVASNVEPGNSVGGQTIEITNTSFWED